MAPSRTTSFGPLTLPEFQECIFDPRDTILVIDFQHRLVDNKRDDLMAAHHASIEHDPGTNNVYISVLPVHIGKNLAGHRVGLDNSVDLKNRFEITIYHPPHFVRSLIGPTHRPQ